MACEPALLVSGAYDNIFGPTTYKGTVIELDGGRVLEHVPPPFVASILLLRVARVHHLVHGRYDGAAHQGELVVDQASVQTRDECT